MIDSGRRALANGDPQATLDTVDAYDARFPGGALAQESEELRIEALFRTAKRQQAEKLAARFLSAHPTSPYARVIRGLVAAPARAE
jgi:outer membrane protein assembly factor BamD (BamD/ComL family)